MAQSSDSPTIGAPFKTGKRGEKLFEDWVSDDWICRKQEPDVFLDYCVEIVENGEPTGRQFYAQVKGFDPSKRKRKGLSYSAKTKQVRYWLQDCQHPVFLFLINAETRVGYWLFVQGFVRDHIRPGALQKQKRITFEFAERNDLQNREAFINFLKHAESYVRDLHPGSIKAAIDARHRELEVEDPRFSYEITLESGVPTIHIAPKQTVNFKVEVRPEQVESVRLAMKEALSRGHDLKLTADQIHFSGSPLVDGFNKGHGELTLRFSEPVPGHILLHPRAAARATEDIHLAGQHRIGTESASFEGRLPDAPLVVQSEVGSPDSPTGAWLRVMLNFPFAAWYGQPVRELPYFEQVRCCLRDFSNGVGVDFSLFAKGNLVGTAELNGNASEGSLYHIVQWIAQLRAIAARYRINPSLPDLDKAVSAEAWETVEDIFRLMDSNRIITPYPGFGATFTLTCGNSELVDVPGSGCIRLDDHTPDVQIFGERIRTGRLRTIYTNVTIEPSPCDGPGIRALSVRGSDSTLRIIEKF